MAHFRGTVEGHQGSENQLKDSQCMIVTANGWNVGITAHLEFDKELKCDVVKLRANGGNSSLPASQFLIGYLVEGQGKTLFKDLSILKGTLKP